jgi:hypothetical protein
MAEEFQDMTFEERDEAARELERELSFDETRPLSRESELLWKMAKGDRGRADQSGSRRDEPPPAV